MLLSSLAIPYDLDKELVVSDDSLARGLPGWLRWTSAGGARFLASREFEMRFYLFGLLNAL